MANKSDFFLRPPPILFAKMPGTLAVVNSVKLLGNPGTNVICEAAYNSLVPKATWKFTFYTSQKKHLSRENMRKHVISYKILRSFRWFRVGLPHKCVRPTTRKLCATSWRPRMQNHVWWSLFNLLSCSRNFFWWLKYPWFVLPCSFGGVCGVDFDPACGSYLLATKFHLEADHRIFNLNMARIWRVHQVLHLQYQITSNYFRFIVFGFRFFFRMLVGFWHFLTQTYHFSPNKKKLSLGEAHWRFEANCEKADRNFSTCAATVFWGFWSCAIWEAQIFRLWLEQLLVNYGQFWKCHSLQIEGAQGKLRSVSGKKWLKTKKHTIHLSKCLWCLPQVETTWNI